MKSTSFHTVAELRFAHKPKRCMGGACHPSLFARTEPRPCSFSASTSRTEKGSPFAFMIQAYLGGVDSLSASRAIDGQNVDPNPRGKVLLKNAPKKVWVIQDLLRFGKNLMASNCEMPPLWATSETKFSRFEKEVPTIKCYPCFPRGFCSERNKGS